MDNHQIRLELVKAVVPQATRVSMTEPEHIVKVCAALEEYVLNSNNGETLPDSPTSRKPGRPRRTTDNDAAGSPGPTHGG
jgi:hypothetical protein